MVDMDCGMKMYFHWDSSDDCVLFKKWKVDETGKYILTCFGLFILCIIREFVLYASKYYEIKTLSGKPVPFWPTFKRLNELSTLYSVVNPSQSGISDKMIPHKKSNDDYHKSVTLELRIIDTFLYGISLILGYSLMLIVMTFNVGLIIVIVCGYCFGRFLFHRQVQLLQKFAVLGQKTQELQDADHCHIRS